MKFGWEIDPVPKLQVFVTPGKIFWNCFWRTTRLQINLWPCWSNSWWDISKNNFPSTRALVDILNTRDIFNKRLSHFTKETQRQKKISQLRSKRVIQGKKKASYLTLKTQDQLTINKCDQPHQLLADMGTTLSTLKLVIFAQFLP